MRRALVSLILATVLVILSSSTSLIPTASGDPGEIWVWATDNDGNKKELFYPTDTVYVKGVGLQKGVEYEISIVEDTGSQIGPNDPIPTPAITVIEIQTSSQDGSFGPEPIWSPPDVTPGYYDVFADCLDVGEPGTYEPGIDAKDEESPIITTAGLFVITETPLGTIAVLIASFTATLIIKRKRIL